MINEQSLCYKVSIVSVVGNFTDGDKDIMKDLPNKEYDLLEPSQLTQASLSLVDIMFAYLYDVRIWENENNTESAWNITKLAATLSCSKVKHPLHSNLLNCLKVSLILFSTETITSYLINEIFVPPS